MDRFNNRFGSKQFSQPGVLYRESGYSQGKQIKLYRESIEAYLKHWGFEISTQVLLDSLGITKLTEENYHLAMREICKKGIEKEYGEQKEESKAL